jgi:hypothetical protein
MTVQDLEARFDCGYWVHPGGLNGVGGEEAAWKRKEASSRGEGCWPLRRSQGDGIGGMGGPGEQPEWLSAGMDRASRVPNGGMDQVERCNWMACLTLRAAGPAAAGCSMERRIAVLTDWMAVSCKLDMAFQRSIRSSANLGTGGGSTVLGEPASGQKVARSPNPRSNLAVPSQAVRRVRLAGINSDRLGRHSYSRQWLAANALPCRREVRSAQVV